MIWVLVKIVGETVEYSQSLITKSNYKIINKYFCNFIIRTYINRIIIYICIIIFISFTDAPIVTLHPSNITVNESEDFVMICNYDANPAGLTAVKW